MPRSVRMYRLPSYQKFQLVNFALLSILILCNISASKSTSVFTTNILSRGHAILNITKQPNVVFDRLEELWRDLFMVHNSFLSDSLNPDTFKVALGVTNASMEECSTPDAIGQADNSKCTPEMRKNIQIAEEYRQTAIAVQTHLENIDTLYRTVFTSDRQESSQPFYIADSLYQYIISICSNSTSCFFNRMARLHDVHAHQLKSSSSINGELYYLYLIIVYHFLKGYAAEMYRYGPSTDEDQLDNFRYIAQRKFVVHTQTIGHIAISALKYASKHITREEPTSINAPLDSPSLELEWYISQIIVNEINLDPQAICTKGCDYYYDKETTYHKAGFVPSEGTDVCKGTMSQCYRQPRGKLYPAGRGARRYDGIKLSNGTSYGIVDSTKVSRAKDTELLYYKNSVFSCEICTCICDDHDNPDTIRAFSLRAVTSNIERNMVITGLKLVEIDGVIHIKIREGRLVDLSRVNVTDWVPVVDFDKTNVSPDNYFTLRLPCQNTVNLDTISLDDEFVQSHIRRNDPNYMLKADYVLTGVKFTSQAGALTFGIRLSRWDANRNRISLRTWNNWIFNRNLYHRKEIILEEPDVPTKTNDNVEFIGEDYYVKFRPTDNVKDFGQTTVPFLDMRSVTTDPPMPLSGAGLFFRGKKGYGGVIGLKLVSIDFSNLIATQLP